jgi:hypothetical protein
MKNKTLTTFRFETKVQYFLMAKLYECWKFLRVRVRVWVRVRVGVRVIVVKRENRENKTKNSELAVPNEERSQPSSTTKYFHGTRPTDSDEELSTDSDSAQFIARTYLVVVNIGHYSSRDTPS